MYCCVIFGANEKHHTRNYLYKCESGLIPGELVIVPAKNTTKIALVKVVFDILPEMLNIDKAKIKSIVSKNKEIINENLVKSYLLALIDDYKDGEISKEEFYAIIHYFVCSSKFSINGDDLRYIINQQLPDACLFYIDEPGAADEKELEFWKELKDIEYKLRYGFSFWEKADNNFRIIEEDPIEYTDTYLKIELELERLIRSEIGDNNGQMGFCHKYWCTKKKILKDRFGIEWKSPKNMNPRAIFD